MIKKELFVLNQGLVSVGELKGNSENRVKFGYAVSKNSKKVEAEVSLLQQAINPSEKFVEYNNKRIEINEKYCKRDESGKPIEEKDHRGVGIYVFESEDVEKKDKEMSDLMNEYEDALKEREEQLKNYNDILEEECDFDVYKIPLSYVPDDITPSQMRLIDAMIEDED